MTSGTTQLESGTPLKAGLSPAAAHLQAAASAAELQKSIFSKKLHYTAFGKVWYGAKYSHRVWQQFANTLEKQYFLLKSRSVNYFLFGPIFGYLGTREM